MAADRVDGSRMTSRANLVLAIALGLVAVVAVVGGVVSATSSVTEYDRSTPEGVVQAYLGALIDGDVDAAAEYLAEDSDCSVTDLEEAYLSDEIRVVLRETEIESDTARVQVDVAWSWGGLFAGSERFEKHTLRLSRTGESWRLTGSPWPTYDCTRLGY